MDGVSVVRTALKAFCAELKELGAAGTVRREIATHCPENGITQAHTEFGAGLSSRVAAQVLARYVAHNATSPVFFQLPMPAGAEGSIEASEASSKTATLRYTRYVVPQGKDICRLDVVFQRAP